MGKVNQDIGISTEQAAAIAGVSPGAIRHWVRAGLVEPSRYEGGVGNHARYNLRDATALRAIADLRRGGVSMPNVRSVQRILRDAGEGDYDSCRLAAVDRGARSVDVVLVKGDRERDALALSLLENPGQALITELALDAIEKMTKRGFAEAVANPPAKRGRRPTAKTSARLRRSG